MHLFFIELTNYPRMILKRVSSFINLIKEINEEIFR